MSLDNVPVADTTISITLEDCVEVLDNLRKPVNNSERLARIENKKANELYPYYGATGQVGWIDDYLFDGEFIALGEDGVPFLDPFKNKAYMLHGKTWVNNHAHVLLAIKGVSINKYIFYFLNYFDYLGYVNGGTRLKLTQANMRKIPINLPSLNEQQEIVRQLDVMLAQVEQIKARLDAIPAILKKFRQSVLADAVSGELINQDFSQLPVESFSDYLTDVRYGTSKKCSESLIDAVPVLRIPNIADDGTLDFTNLKYAEFESKEIKQLQLSKGDLLLIRSNGSLDLVGKSAIANELDRVVLYAGYLIRLRFNDSVNPQFIQYYLKAPQTRQIIENIARSTSGVNNINSKEIASLKIKLPCIDHQNEVVLRVKQLLELSKRIEETIQSAQKRVNLLTQSILAKAFSGELTIEWREQHQELITGINSAESLLAKIQAGREAIKPVKKAKKVK